MKDDAFKQFFLDMANDIIESGTWPVVFKQSVTVIIPKPKKDDYSKAKSYRPNHHHPFLTSYHHHLSHISRTNTCFFNAAPQDGILASASLWFLHRLAFFHFSFSSSLCSFLPPPHFYHQCVFLWFRSPLPVLFHFFCYLPLWSFFAYSCSHLHKAAKNIQKHPHNKKKSLPLLGRAVHTQATAGPPRVRAYANLLCLAKNSIHCCRARCCLKAGLSDRYALIGSHY